MVSTLRGGGGRALVASTLTSGAVVRIFATERPHVALPTPKSSRIVIEMSNLGIFSQSLEFGNGEAHCFMEWSSPEQFRRLYIPVFAEGFLISGRDRRVSELHCDAAGWNNTPYNSVVFAALKLPREPATPLVRNASYIQIIRNPMDELSKPMHHTR